MAKINKALIIVCSLLLLLCGCSDSNDPVDDDGKLETLTISDKLDKSQFQDLNNVSAPEPLLLFDNYYIYDDVSIKLDSDTYDMENKTLDITLMNKTDSKVYGDRNFQLEICLDGLWYIIPPVNYSIIDLAYEYPPGEYTEKLNLSEIDVDFIAGEYRIIKEYHIDNFEGVIVSPYNFTLKE